MIASTSESRVCVMIYFKVVLILCKKLTRRSPLVGHDGSRGNFENAQIQRFYRRAKNDSSSITMTLQSEELYFSK